MTARLVIVSAPSGAGKTTITRRLVELQPTKFGLSISATTREPRKGETEGQAYYFLSRPEFARWKQSGRFLETAEYAGEWYGTPKSEVDRILASGRHALLDIEVVGAEQIRGSWKGEPPITVFVLPTSPRVLLDRLSERKTESPEQLLKRVTRASEELSYSRKYDRLLRNDNLEDAVAALGKIVDEGGGFQRTPPNDMRWVEQFSNGLREEEVRLHTHLKGST